MPATTPPNEHVLQRMKSEPIIWLSTVRPDGRPHLVPVWFLLQDDGTILIFSKPNNQKLRNLEHNPNVTLALEAANQGGDIVMLEGTAELLPSGSVNAAALEPYVSKYGATMQAMGWQAEGMAKEYSEPIRITPTRYISWGE